MSVPENFLAYLPPAQAKGAKSILFLTYVRNKIDLIPYVAQILPFMNRPNQTEPGILHRKRSFFSEHSYCLQIYLRYSLNRFQDSVKTRT